MKLSLSLIIVFIIISPTVWSQSESWNPVPGLVQIEKRGDNTKLIFEFACQNRRGQATSCKKEVEDKDGLASLIAVQSTLKQHYVCSNSNSNDEVPHWENIKPFIQSRLQLLLRRCHESLCDTSSERIAYCSNEDYRRRNEDRCRRDSEIHTQVDSESGSNNSKNKMEFCGDLAADYEGIETLLSSSNPTYNNLNKLGDFLSKHEPYYKYKVKTDFDQGKDYDAREHILSDTISSNENSSDNLISQHHKRFGGQEDSLRFTNSTSSNRILTLSRDDNNCPASDTSTEVSAHLHQLITSYNNNRRSFWRRIVPGVR